jgi:hypothetical protein
MQFKGANTSKLEFTYNLYYQPMCLALQSMLYYFSIQSLSQLQHCFNGPSGMQLLHSMCGDTHRFLL